LQRLADVVRLPQRRVRIHYDVDLDKIVLKEGSTAHTKNSNAITNRAAL
jgi:hypothetical protein